MADSSELNILLRKVLGDAAYRARFLRQPGPAAAELGITLGNAQIKVVTALRRLLRGQADGGGAMADVMVASRISGPNKLPRLPMTRSAPKAKSKTAKKAAKKAARPKKK
jgi:hypothetical protein